MPSCAFGGGGGVVAARHRLPSVLSAAAPAPPHPCAPRPGSCCPGPPAGLKRKFKHWCTAVLGSRRRWLPRPQTALTCRHASPCCSASASKAHLRRGPLLLHVHPAGHLARVKVRGACGGAGAAASAGDAAGGGGANHLPARGAGRSAAINSTHAAQITDGPREGQGGDRDGQALWPPHVCALQAEQAAEQATRNALSSGRAPDKAARAGTCVFVQPR